MGCIRCSLVLEVDRHSLYVHQLAGRLEDEAARLGDELGVQLGRAVRGWSGGAPEARHPTWSASALEHVTERRSAANTVTSAFFVARMYSSVHRAIE